MEFLKTATMAPMNSMGPVGMMIAFIVWVICLYFGYRYATFARKVSGMGYVIAFLGSCVMVAGLLLMTTTNLIDDKNSFLTATFAVIALVSFGSIGGFIALMSASCGFIFGVIVRFLGTLPIGRR